jgi:hypothetical protein
MQKLGHRLEVASSSAAAAGSYEPASAKAAGTDPRPPPGGRVKYGEPIGCKGSTYFWQC